MALQDNPRYKPLYRGTMLPSIWGGRLGLDGDNMLVGALDHKREVRSISTTVPTTIAAHGLTRFLTSGSSQGPTVHQLDAPIVGVDVTFMLNSTSTGSQQIGTTVAGAAIHLTSLGSTVGGTVVNLLGPGGSITLTGLTTSLWGVKSMYDQSSTAGVRNISFTTST